MTDKVQDASRQPPAAASDIPGTGWHSRRTMAALLIIGFIANAAWRIWLSRGTTMPIAHGDEDSYLHTARVIAGGPGGYSSENALLRRVGYPLLISPSYLLGLDFFTTYRIVQVLNAIANAAVFPLAYLLGRRMLRFDRGPAYAAAFAAATLPAVAFYAGVAMTDVVLAPLTLAWILAVHTWLRKPERFRPAIVSGILAGAFYTVHVRGIVITGLELAVVALLLYRRRIPGRVALGVFTSIAVPAAANHLIILLLGDRLRLTGVSPGGQTASAVASGAGLVRLSATVGTNLWYMVIISFGLAALGWFGAVREVLRPTREPAFRATMLLLLAATAGVLLGAALILTGVGNTASDAFYARYIHMLTPVWLLIGLSVLLTAGTRRAVQFTALALTIMGTGGALISLRMARAAAAGHPMRYGTFGAHDLMALTSWHHGMIAWTGVVVGAGAALVLLGASRAPRLRTPMVLALVLTNIVTMGIIARDQTAPVARARTPVPRLVADLGVRAGERLAADVNTPYVFRIALAHEVTWTFVPNFGKGGPPAGTDVVIANWDPGQPADWPGAAYGFHSLGGNPAQHWAVWRRN